MRILVGDLAVGVPRVVHVRDTLLNALDQPASARARSALELTGETPVYEVLAHMRATSQQLVVVVDEGKFRGIVTLSDVLSRLLPRAEAAAG
jgi:CBS domain containing-hemolysin-like protein